MNDTTMTMAWTSAFALLLLFTHVAFAQEWTAGGRRKHVGKLLPTQSCYVTEVSIVHTSFFLMYYITHNLNF